MSCRKSNDSRKKIFHHFGSIEKGEEDFITKSLKMVERGAKNCVFHGLIFYEHSPHIFKSKLPSSSSPCEFSMSSAAKCVQNQREKKWKIKVEILGAEKRRKSSDIINRYELDNPQLNKSWRENDDEKKGGNEAGERWGNFYVLKIFFVALSTMIATKKKVFVCAYVKLCCEIRKATCCDEDNEGISRVSY